MKFFFFLILIMGENYILKLYNFHQKVNYLFYFH